MARVIGSAPISIVEEHGPSGSLLVSVFPTVIPTLAWSGGIAAAILIGAATGLVPALRAARMSPTQALWTL